jgi:hypothetical protein
MFITYHRVGKLSVPAALAAVAAAVVLGGLAAIAIAIIGVAVGAAWLLRAAGIGRAARRVPPQDHNTIEGVVVDSTEALSRSNARR